MTASRVGALWVAAWLSVVGCGDKKGADPAVGMAKASLKGRVYSADTGKPVKGVTIVDASGASAKTDASGVFEMQRDRMASQVSIDGKDYAESHKEVPASDVYLDVPMKEVDVTKEFDPSKGAELEVKGGAKVEIPSNALVTSERQKPSGRVTAKLTSIDPKSPAQVSALPGSGRARSGKKPGQIAVRGVIDLSAKDEKGEVLTTQKEKGIIADFPAGADAKTEVDTFSFNAKTGDWEKEGTAVLDKDKRVYRAKVKHLSWWAIGDFVDSLSCVRGCVNGADGKPSIGARVTASGVDYVSLQSAFADDKGCFALDAKAGAEVAIQALTADGETESMIITLSENEHSAAKDPESCKDLGTLEVGKGASCPFGFESCDDTCLDTSRDDANCGGCGTLCDKGTSCVAGQCEGSTVDTRADGGQTQTDAGPVLPACPIGDWSTPITDAESVCQGKVGTVTYTIVDEGGGRFAVTETIDNLFTAPDVCGSSRAGTATYEGNQVALHFADDSAGCTQDYAQTFTVDETCSTMSTDGDTTVTNCGSCDADNLCVECGTVSCTAPGSVLMLMKNAPP